MKLIFAPICQREAENSHAAINSPHNRRKINNIPKKQKLILAANLPGRKREGAINSTHN